MRYKKGFTLVELLVSALILSLMLLITGYIFSQVVQGSAGSEAKVTADEKARLALDKMTRRIREGVYADVTASDLYVMVSDSAGNLSQVRFWRSGNDILTSVGGVTYSVPVATDVTDLVFSPVGLTSYYNQRSIFITVEITLNQGTRREKRRRVTSSVYCRSFR